MQENNITNKIKSIPLIIILVSSILIIVLTIFSFNIYATYVNESENQNILIDNNVEIDDNRNSNNDENVIQVILSDTEDIIDVEELSDVVQDEEKQYNEIVENNERSNVQTYTTSNGEKYTIIAYLNIPSLGINYPVLSSTSNALLKISLNKFWGGNPNEVGNMVVLGHNYKDGRFFSKLLNIQKGAIIQVTDSTGRTLDYKVYETGIIDPYDTKCTSQLTNGHTEVTLITCYYENGNVHATKRFYVKARAN